MHLGIVSADGSRDVLQDGGLARLRRRDDKATLTLTDGGNQVDHARGDGVLAMLHAQTLLRVNRREIGETHATAKLFNRGAVHGDDLMNGAILLVRSDGPGLRHNKIALAQAVALNQRKADITIVLAGQIALRAHETVAVGKDVENARHLKEALSLDGCVVHGLNQLGLLQPGDVKLELGGLRAKIGDL